MSENKIIHLADRRLSPETADPRVWFMRYVVVPVQEKMIAKKYGSFRDRTVTLSARITDLVVEKFLVCYGKYQDEPNAETRLARALFHFTYHCFIDDIRKQIPSLKPLNTIEDDQLVIFQDTIIETWRQWLSILAARRGVLPK